MNRIATLRGAMSDSSAESKYKQHRHPLSIVIIIGSAIIVCMGIGVSADRISGAESRELIPAVWLTIALFCAAHWYVFLYSLILQKRLPDDNILTPSLDGLTLASAMAFHVWVLSVLPSGNGSTALAAFTGLTFALLPSLPSTYCTLKAVFAFRRADYRGAEKWTARSYVLSPKSLRGDFRNLRRWIYALLYLGRYEHACERAMVLIERCRAYSSGRSPHPKWAETLFLCSVCRSFNGEYAVALMDIESAVGNLKDIEIGGWVTRTLCHSQQASLRVDMNDLDGALAHLHSSEAAFGRCRKPGRTASNFFITKARYWLARNNPDTAEYYYNAYRMSIASEYGANHLLNVTALKELSSVCRKRNQIEEAEKLAQEALAIVEQHGLGPHPYAAACLRELGFIALQKGAPDEAADHFNKAREIQRSALRADHPALAETLHGLALALLSLNRNADARSALERAMSIYEPVFPPDHPKIVECREALDRAKSGLGTA